VSGENANNAIARWISFKQTSEYGVKCFLAYLIASWYWLDFTRLIYSWNLNFNF